MSEKHEAPFVFVLMPFAKSFDDIYEVGIKQACRNLGVRCERVDEQIFMEPILRRVYDQITNADIVISDMTGRNANVFYETGYAHAVNKRVILLTQDVEDIPFDLQHFQHIVYGGSISQLRDKLVERIRWCFMNPPVFETTSTAITNEEAVARRVNIEQRQHRPAGKMVSNIFWRSEWENGKEGESDLFFFYVDGEPIHTRCKFIRGGDEVFVYDPEFENYYRIEQYTKYCGDGKLHRAVTSNSPGEILWRSVWKKGEENENDLYYFFVNGESIQSRTKFMKDGDGAVIYDPKSDKYYRIEGYNQYRGDAKLHKATPIEPGEIG